MLGGIGCWEHCADGQSRLLHRCVARVRFGGLHALVGLGHVALTGCVHVWTVFGDCFVARWI